MPEKATGAGEVSARMFLPAANGQQNLPHCLTTSSLLPPGIHDLGPAHLSRSVSTSNFGGLTQAPCPCCHPTG